MKINTRTNTGNRGFRDFQSAKLQMNSSFTGKKPAGLPGDTISTVKQFDNNQNIQVDSGWRELDTIPKQQAEKVGQQGEKQVNGDKEEKIDHQQTEGVRARIVQPQDRQVQRQVEQERIQRQLYEHTPTTRPTANPTTNPTTRPTKSIAKGTAEAKKIKIIQVKKSCQICLYKLLEEEFLLEYSLCLS